MFWENFVKLCVQMNTKPNPVAKELGIPSGSVSDWKKGRIPRDTTLQKIADYFGVSVNELLGKETSSKQAENVSPETKKLLERIKQLDEAALKELNDFADYLIAKKKGGV